MKIQVYSKQGLEVQSSESNLSKHKSISKKVKQQERESNFFSRVQK